MRDGRCIDSGLAHCLRALLPAARQYSGWLAANPVWLAPHHPLSRSHLSQALDSTLRCTLFKCKWASFRNINVLLPLLTLCFCLHPPPSWPALVALYCRVDLAKPGVRGTSIIIQPCVSACRRQLLVLALLVPLLLTNDYALELLANLQSKPDSYVNINKYIRRAGY